VLLAILVAACCVCIVLPLFFLSSRTRRLDGYGGFFELYSWAIRIFEARLQPRVIDSFFSNYSRRLSFPASAAFGARALGIALRSFSGDSVAAATVSLFEAPPGSGHHSTVTIHVLPRAGIPAPILHIDVIKPMAGMPGACILDFLNVDESFISYASFFGGDAASIETSMRSVEPYQRSIERGRGKISRYLDPYKSPYRLELTEPANDAQAKGDYYRKAIDAISSILPMYLEKTCALSVDERQVEAHSSALGRLIDALRSNDFAVKMGIRIFKEDFGKYWLEGFWNVEKPIGRGTTA
jgi:hypothetical protein